MDTKTASNAQGGRKSIGDSMKQSVDLRRQFATEMTQRFVNLVMPSDSK
jgi:hypothetical protein